MEIFNTITAVKKSLELYRNQGKSIGLVPTMGALHEGHLSLIRKCINDNSITVVSIFINPTQFNDPDDYKRYPRDLDLDLKILKQYSCDVVFVPSVDEMYPEKDTRIFNFGSLDKHMEGKYRPDHFNGVALVVTKLFEIINPHKAYFGEKDFQQLAIIKDLTKKLDLPVTIIGCPVIREKDGLAMSSRNSLLSPEERKSATIIFSTLNKIKSQTGKMSVNGVKNYVRDTINKDPLLEIEYFEIVDAYELKPIKKWTENIPSVGCIAIHVGQVRLIDNIKFS